MQITVVFLTTIVKVGLIVEEKEVVMFPIHSDDYTLVVFFKNR